MQIVLNNPHRRRKLPCAHAREKASGEPCKKRSYLWLSLDPRLISSNLHSVSWEANCSDEWSCSSHVWPRVRNSFFHLQLLNLVRSKKVEIKKTPKIGTPGYKVVKQLDHQTGISFDREFLLGPFGFFFSGQRSLLFQVQFPEIASGVQPRVRIMSSFEQKIEPPNRDYQFVFRVLESPFFSFEHTGIFSSLLSRTIPLPSKCQIWPSISLLENFLPTGTRRSLFLL